MHRWEWTKNHLFSIGTVLLLGGAAGILIGFSAILFTNLPQVERLEHYKPAGATQLLDIHGKVIHEFFHERRHPIPLHLIPERTQKAFLAAEDWRFYEHFGLDIKGLFRAIVKNILSGRYAEGASTITQQLTKVLFLTPEKTLARKLKEAFLALQIERRYSKKEILSLYLNQIYFGAGAYGIEAAAQTYFGHGVQNLHPSEVALLAGLPKAPHRYSPFHFPERSLKRRNVILKAMYERRLISESEWRQAQGEPLPDPERQSRRAQSYFAAHVLKTLSEHFDEDMIYRGNLTVKTTLDLNLQKAAEKAVSLGLELYRKRHPKKSPDSLPQAALLAIDPVTGEIRAMVGGDSYAKTQYNRTTQALRQPGSAFKPILYAAAIERGYTQSTMLLDEKISFHNSQSGVWEPENYEDEYEGLIPMRRALEKSKNLASIRLLQDLGVSTLTQMASRLGIESPIAANLTSALGSSSIHMTELARAYATFAHGGIRPNLRSIRHVFSPNGNERWAPPIPSQLVVPPTVAFIMTDMLNGVVRFGTGQFAKNLSCEVAGKTGTTDEYIDAWFAGYSPKLVTVAWMGNDDRTSLGYAESGARAAGPIWKAFMEKACENRELEFPPPPPGIEWVNIDRTTGKLPGPFSLDIISQAYIKGSRPSEISEEKEFPVN